MSSRREYDDRDGHRSRSRKGGRDADDSYRREADEAYRKVTRREDSRSRQPPKRSDSRRRSDDRGSDRSRGRERDDDRSRGRERDDDRSRGRERDDDRRSDRRDDDRGRGRDDDRDRGRYDDRSRGRDDDRDRGRYDDRGRGREDDRGRDRGRDDGDSRGGRKKTGWGDEGNNDSAKANEAPPDWLSDLVGGGGGSAAQKMELGGCGFGGPPPAGTRLNCKTIQIPVAAKPWLIGTGGKTINEIRAKSQSMIQINNNGPGDKNVTVMITGNVDMVEKLIHEHLGDWFTPSPSLMKPNEQIIQQGLAAIRSGGLPPSQLAPPAQLSAASIWNWNS